MNRLLFVAVDIRLNGDIRDPDELLERLDYTIVSVRNDLSIGELSQTKRLVGAASHPHASILGHPTGRQLRRPSFGLAHQAI